MTNRHDDTLSALDWRDFERLLAAHYRDAGYTVEETGTANGGRRFDGGIDLRLTRGSEVVLVQCKHWNAMKVPHNDVHELLGIVATQRANRAILVSSGEFTDAAKRAASQSDERIELIDGQRLREMLGDRLPPPDPMQRAWQVAAATMQGRPRRVLRGWWRGQLAFAAIKLVFVAGAGLLAWSFFHHAMGKFAQSQTARATARASVPPQSYQPPPPPAAPSLSIAPHVPRVPMSPQERQMRLELVRHSVLELDGVTSSVWLPDGALMIGMGASTAQARGSVAALACEILGRYPEMGRVVEVRDTRARSAEAARPSTVVCG